jgi:hypothetical protein
MTNLQTSLTEAWAERANIAAKTLGHAAKAPTLFRPERIAELEAEFDRAVSQHNYWQRLGGQSLAAAPERDGQESE